MRREASGSCGRRLTKYTAIAPDKRDDSEISHDLGPAMDMMARSK